MADGVWSDKKDKVFVSTQPSAFSLQPRLVAPALLITGNESIRSPDYSWRPSRGVRDRSPPGLLTSKADGGVLVVRRRGRTRKAPPGERIGRRSRRSWI